MNCLKDYIGLKNCALAAPASGKYVNMLPGISTELADKIASSEKVTFAQVWDDVQERAYMRLKNDIINQMSDEVKLNEVVYQTRKLLKSQKNPVEVLRGEEYRGVYIMLPESKYSSLRLVEVFVYSKQAVSTVLKVWDLNDEKELYSLAVDLVVGLNTITIPVDSVEFNLKYRIQEYFIAIDAADFDSIETMNDYYSWYDADMCCASISNNGSFQILPAILDKTLDPTYDNIVKSGTGKGISIGAEVLCSVDQFICENRHHLEESFLYLLGEELLMEKLSVSLGSTRLNYFTATNKEQTEKTMLDFNFKYMNRLKSKLKAIPLRGESMCFSCEEASRIGYKGMMP